MLISVKKDFYNGYVDATAERVRVFCTLASIPLPIPIETAQRHMQAAVNEAAARLQKKLVEIGFEAEIIRPAAIEILPYRSLKYEAVLTVKGQQEPEKLGGLRFAALGKDDFDKLWREIKSEKGKINVEVPG
jgi:hypothetical protein